MQFFGRKKLPRVSWPTNNFFIVTVIKSVQVSLVLHKLLLVLFSLYPVSYLTKES